MTRTSLPEVEPLDSPNPYAAGKVLVRPDIRLDVIRHNELLMLTGELDEGISTERVMFDVTKPASIREMCDMIESEVLPLLRSLGSFADFVAFRASLGYRDWHPCPVETIDRMLIAGAEGDFRTAQDSWHSDERDKALHGRGTRLLPGPRSWRPSDCRQYLAPLGGVGGEE